MSDKHYITKQGFVKIKNELKQLKEYERIAIIKDIVTAREKGDLSENADYHAARERQSFLEGRIEDLENIIAQAKVIDTALLVGETVKFGALVTLQDQETRQIVTYRIVGECEADIKQNLLSIRSPLARALLNKRIGEYAEVITPKGEKLYLIKDIKYS